MAIYRADVPLGETSQPERVSVSFDEKPTKKTKEKDDASNKTVTDIGTALADITRRASERQKLKDASNKKVRDSIAERRKTEGTKQTGTGKLIGLKGLGDYGK